MNDNNSNTAAQPLDLDKLEALAKAATPGPWNVTKYCSVMDERMDTLVVSSDSSHEDRAYIAAANPQTVLALIAQARAAQPVAIILPGEKWSKGNDSEGNENRDELACAGINIDTDDFPHQNAVEFYAQTLSAAQARRDAVLSAIQRAAQLDTTASVSGEREGWEAAAKALSERAAGHSRNKNYTLQDECLQCASMLHDMKPGHTTLAPIAAQQAAAAPIKQYIGGRMVHFVVAPAGAKVTFGPDENTVHVEFAQQAAAVAAPSEQQANVMPPFAAPAGIDKDAWVEEISEVAELYGRLLAEKQRVHIAKGRDRGTEYYIADGIRWAIGELERRCRAQGGVTNSNSVEFGGINLSAVAATTSEDVRDAARLDWLEQNKATLTRKFDDSAYILAVEGRAIRTSTSAREAVDAAMRANQQEGE